MSLPVPQELQGCSQSALEDYVNSRLKQFTRVFASQLVPSAPEHVVEAAFSRAIHVIGSAQPQRSSDSVLVRFWHKCRFLGCSRKECQLCKNNPNKRCREDDNFDECYADSQVLKAKCEADVYLEMVNKHTGAATSLPGLELVVTVVDGESYNEAAPGNYGQVKELLKNDEGNILLGTYLAGSKTEADGKLYLKLQDGQVKLPDVCITDKNDTFHMNGETFSSFRLMARVIKRDLYGNPTLVDDPPPCISGKFIVKTQRALNDYRKSEYPHYKDELTKLKHIGSITASRLRDIQQHLECPYTAIETVEQLKQLMQYADQNRQVENKLLELLNMKGKHKHKWDYLREVLAERVVYDDMFHRAWFADDSQGLLFACKQAQINLDRPLGLVQRVTSNGQSRLLVSTAANLDQQQTERLKQWRSMAEQTWYTPGHRGWSAVQEPLEMVGVGGGASIVISGVGGGGSMNLASNMSMALSDTLDDGQGIARRSSMSVQQVGEPARTSRRSSVSYPTGGPDMGAAGPSSGGFLSGGAVETMQQLAGQHGFQFGTHRPMAATITSGGMGDLGPMFMAGLQGQLSAPSFQRTSAELESHSGPLPPPPVRSTRYRRLSADAGATTMRHLAMMQAASLQQISGPEDVADLGSKRVRASAPGSSLLDEPDANGPASDDLPGPASRHMLYHFESRGRHTPRSRLNLDNIDAPGAMGNVLEPSEIENYLASNFAFLGGQSGGLHTDKLTGQMQQTLILSEQVSLGEHMGDMHANDLQAAAAGMMGGLQAQAVAVAGANDNDAPYIPPGRRELRHCESDSFKRFLQHGLPFAPLEGMPEAYEGQSSDISSMEP